MIPITCNAVGDIIAIAALVLDVARALKDTRGSASEHRKFSGELEALHKMLTTTARVAGDSVDNVLRDEIIREVAQCSRDVQSALSRIAKFSALDKNVATGGGLRVKLQRNWYKLEWRLAKRDEAQAVREELANATQRLTTLLVVSDADGAVRFRRNMLYQVDASVARDATLLRAIDSNTMILNRLDAAHRGHALVQELSEAVPTSVDNTTAAIAVLCAAVCAMHAPYDHTVPTALLLVAIYILSQSSGRHERALVQDVAYKATNAVTLHDAMGRDLMLPIELCETSELFHATLVNLFSQTNARWFIDTRRYGLKLWSGGHRIFRWVIQPNVEIVMSIIVKTAIFKYPTTIQCPACLVETEVENRFFGLRCLCSGCGISLDNCERGWPPHESDSLFKMEEASKSIKYYPNDLGRFPRARPTAVSGGQHKSSTSSPNQHIHLPCSSKPLFDTANRPKHGLNWQNQICGFTRFIILMPQSNLDESHPWLDLEDRLELHMAAGNGHYALVKELLYRGADVNAADSKGRTALHLAALNGHTRVAQLLLDRGALVNAATVDDITPIAYAVSDTQLMTTALLLARGAMTDASESMRAAVLYAAASVNDVNILQILIRLGLDVNIRFRGDTALNTAIFFGAMGAVSILLQNGADVNLESETGTRDTPLSRAAYRGSVKLFKLLCGYGAMAHYTSSTASDLDKKHLLWCAITGASRAIIATVLQRTGVNLNAHFENGMTPLSYASESKHKAIVELLLSRDADLTVEASPSRWLKKDGSWLALHAAARCGRLEIIKSLLQHGADVNVRTEYGDTALSLALEEKRQALKDYWPGRARYYLDPVLDILVSSGAVVDERSSLLLEDIARLDGSSKNPVPGAWCEEAEQD